MEFVVRNATLADGQRRDVRVVDGRIDAVERSLAGEPGVDAGGKLLLPGMIDVHVHFREPGASHKETWTTGSESAAAGGVTTVVDQPNTSPPTIDGDSFDEKAALAEPSIVDYGLNGGVTPEWTPDELFERPLFALGEVFLADSTGDMGIDPDLFREAVRAAADAEVTVTVHAEDATLFDDAALTGETRGSEESDGHDGDRHDGDGSGDGHGAEDGGDRAVEADRWSAYRTPEAEVAAIETAIDVADEVGAEMHVAHASTPRGVDAAAAAGLTCEVTPHHLFLSRDDLPALGTFGRMNPPLRDEARRAALFERAADPDGPVDVVATDHAPHTREEKDATIREAPSGVPGVETALPLLLAAAERGELTRERVRDLTARNPASIFGLSRKGAIEAGRDADLVLVDPDRRREISADALHSKCRWTPFEGGTGIFPEWTMVRGAVVFAGEEASLPDAFAPAGTSGDASGTNVRE